MTKNTLDVNQNIHILKGYLQNIDIFVTVYVTNMNYQYEKQLMSAGLSNDQANVYETLLKLGTSQASRVSRVTGIPRTLVYRALSKLDELKLISKKDIKGSVSQFTINHPDQLIEIANEKIKIAEREKNDVSSVLGDIFSDYSKISAQPGIRYLPGISGLKDLHDDMINSSVDYMLIRSYKDEEIPEAKSIIVEHLKIKAKNNIKTRAITPTVADDDGAFSQRDKINIVERRFIDEKQWGFPAQITIFAGKVAFTTYDYKLFTTVIEHPDIYQSFILFFEYLWSKQEEFHKNECLRLEKIGLLKNPE